MKCSWLLGITILALATVVGANTGPLSRDDGHRIADEVITEFTGGRFQDVWNRLDERAAKQVSVAQLEQSWQALIQQMGSFEGTGQRRIRDRGEALLVTQTIVFERGRLDLNLGILPSGRLGGLYFTAAADPDMVDAPTLDEGVSEREVLVGKEPWKLPGILTVPAGEGPFPSLVLVHGSGAHDADQTVGPNKPFRDLAHGLANRGIAVLRYAKRAYTHPGRMKAGETLTIDTEVVEDAGHAVRFLATQDEAATGNVFVAGLSLGGKLAPRIALKTPEVAGLVILAGGTRPLPDVLVEQYEYVLSLNPVLTNDQRQEILSHMRSSAEEMKKTDLDPSKVISFPGGTVPASYVISLREYDPVAVARTLSVPILILHGGRDYQVTEKDLARWQEGLSGLDTVEFQVFPDLNHLFMTGEGRATPQEYQQPGNVAEETIEAISEWVHRQALHAADAGQATHRSP